MGLGLNFVTKRKIKSAGQEEFDHRLIDIPMTLVPQKN
jgi:hypothetical protein